ncbi:ATP-dependent DNA helicase [groundwater metagenome]
MTNGMNLLDLIKTGKPEREQIWEYPLEALREALINAVCHRDYTILSHIEIRIFDDRVVIWSPGRLPFGITLEELHKPHSSALRNKGLAEVFFDTELIEQWGNGIEKMQTHCLNAGLPEPIFEANPK